MHEIKSSNAIAQLNEVIVRGREDRQRMAKMLGSFKQSYAKVTGQRDAATAEVERLKKALHASETEKNRLAKRERELAQEVSMMAAAIDVANREIAEQDTLLLDAAVSVNADLSIAPPAETAPAAAKPQQEPVKAQAVAAAKEQPAAKRPEAMPAAEITDEFDENFRDIEKMLAESLKTDIGEKRDSGPWRRASARLQLSVPVDEVHPVPRRRG